MIRFDKLVGVPEDSKPSGDRLAHEDRRLTYSNVDRLMMPVGYATRTNPDGSVQVVLGRYEP